MRVIEETSSHVRASGADLDPLSRTLAASFWDDPIQEWLFPDEAKRTRRLEEAFRREMRWFLSLGTTFTDPNRGAAAVWSPPHSRSIPIVHQMRIAVAYRSLVGRRLKSAIRLLTAIEANRPKESHWYLAILGTHPQHQGKGLATSLLQPILERCDEGGIGAYLESSKESNVPWYERHGFRVTGKVDHPAIPGLWLMWREPGADGN